VERMDSIFDEELRSSIVFDEELRSSIVSWPSVNPGYCDPVKG